MVGVLIYAAQFALSYKQKNLIDLDVFILPAIAIIVLGLFLWETVIIFDFPYKGMSKDKLVLQMTDLQ
ncbi:MAG: hypothetical protein U5K54_26930 [Cytophagales bacterium]|nr:hypothetical protein [Cytophagales bacterium]